MIDDVATEITIISGGIQMAHWMSESVNECNVCMDEWTKQVWVSKKVRQNQEVSQ